MFKFSGAMSSSKSLTNRALIVQSYNPQIQLSFETQSMDVQVLQKSLQDFKSGQNYFYCAEAGTAFRFLVLRLSREPGTWTVSGSSRLLSRPQQGLLDILSHFGVDVEVRSQEWILYSQGWKENQKLTVDARQSSQFISSVLLNSWNLPFDLHLQSTAEKVSEGYFLMTKYLMELFGMQILATEKGYTIPAQQKPLILNYHVEPDVSSSFALAACALQNGDVCIKKFPFRSLQPDLFFLSLFDQMKASWRKEGEDLFVRKTESLKPFAADLTNTPDLFPVLAVLCARAEGVSELSGLSHLSVKESDRLQNTRHLLERLGRKTELIDNKLKIYGEGHEFSGHGAFDPDQDHRMAMAAQVANLYGARFQILNPHVVDKSYPQFWLHTGGLL